MKAMILAAGLGTRLKPFTSQHPKALAEVNGRALLEHNIEWLKQFGVKDIIINTHHFAQQIVDFVEANRSFGINISFSDESDGLLETGGGLKKASWFFKGESDFILMNADVLTDLSLQAMHRQHYSSAALATLAVSERETSRYFLFNEANRLCGWQNISTGERRIAIDVAPLQPLAFSGVQMLNTLIFDQIFQQGKFSMVDVYLAVCVENKVMGYNHTGSRFVDVGKPESITAAEKLFP